MLGIKLDQALLHVEHLYLSHPRRLAEMERATATRPTSENEPIVEDEFVGALRRPEELVTVDIDNQRLVRSRTQFVLQVNAHVPSWPFAIDRITAGIREPVELSLGTDYREQGATLSGKVNECKRRSSGQPQGAVPALTASPCAVLNAADRTSRRCFRGNTSVRPARQRDHPGV